MERNAGSTILGRLELIREETASVGVQVFGPTWAVLDHETGELARTCVLDAELLPDAASRDAFVAGLTALSTLREPTLVPQLFVGVDEQGGAVLYEPLPGGVAFDDLFDGTGSYELTLEVGRLARHLARALAALHAQGHVHGMLASPCVFVGPRGPAIYQYGLAPLCDRAVLLRRARSFGLINLAPEVLAGGDFTPTADLHAWAVTIAQFATSIRGPGALEIVRGSDELSGLTPSLRAALQACLVADPAARPRDGAELLRMIEASGRGEGSGLLVVRAEPEAVAEPNPEAVAEPIPEAVAEPEPVAAVAPAAPAPPRLAVPATGMSLPVTSFEEMLMSGDRARRPATLAPGTMSVAAPPHDEQVDAARASTSGKSANNLRRVHVLTDPVKRGSGEASGVNPVRSEPLGDLLIGGTREEVEAASRATTVRLDSTSIAEAVRTTSLAGPDAAQAPAEPVARPAAPPAAPPRPPPVPSRSPFLTLPPSASRSAEPAAAAAVLAPPAGSRPPSAAVPAAGADAPQPSNGSGSRRRSSALSTAGHGEPRDWGTIPPIKDVAPEPAAVVPAPVTALAPQSARSSTTVVVTLAVVAALLVLAIWLS